MRLWRRRRVRRAARWLILVAAIAAAALFLPWRPEAPVYLTDETEALARVIRSEAGVSSPLERLHIAWATRNLAAERRQTIARMACWPCGPQQAGRPVSSAQAAGDADRRLARDILRASPLLDATGGATHFVNPSLQDALAAEGRPGYRGRPYDVVRRQWGCDYGLERYYRLGPDLEMWGRPRVSSRPTCNGRARASR